jgi:hypothetical protein
MREVLSELNALPPESLAAEQLLATRELMSKTVKDRHGRASSLWNHAVEREAEIVSLETGFARDTKEDPEEVCPPPLPSPPS